MSETLNYSLRTSNRLNWNCPQKLQNFAAETVATILIKRAIPVELKKYPYENSSDAINDFCNISKSFDKIIVAQSPDTQGEHKLLLKCIKSMKEWWMNNSWFRSSNSVVRDLVQDSVSKILNQMDRYLVCPLIKLTFQLCFTKEAGIFNSNYTKIHLEVPKRYCGSPFNEFLEFLSPFEIERFYNVNMVFGSPEPLIAILKNSPCLKLIHLRYNSSDYVLKHIGKYCTELETFVVDECFGRLLVSEKYLYKTFYCGIDKEQLKDKLSKKEAIKLSFPKLKYLDLGKNFGLSEFLSHLRILYPNLESISCNSCNVTAEFLVKFVNFQPNFSYNIVDICLTSRCILSLDKNLTWSILPNIQHVTLFLECLPLDKINEYSEKLIDFLISINFSSLTLHMPFDSICDTDIKTVFSSLFLIIGQHIQALQFDVMRAFDIATLFLLINMCPNLKLLTVRFSKDAAIFEPYNKSVKLNVLPNVKYLSISYEERDIVFFFFDIAGDILSSCMNVVSLELMLPPKAGNWIIKPVTLSIISEKVQSLILQFFETPTLQASFYLRLIDQFPKLKALVLIDLPSTVFVDVVSKRKAYNLDISISRFSKVSYRGLGAKYPML